MNMGRLKEIVAGTRGAEIAEAAVVLPLLFMMLFGIYWFGRAYNIYATINHAAREGARMASAPTCASCGNSFLTVDAIADRVAQALQASKLDPTQVTNSGASRLACAGGPSSCLTPSGGRPNICVYFNIQLDTPAAGPAGCGVGVSFQYPYQFYFPFTSLHMQRINLPAEVQMEGED
jgi:hypothetical protein